MSRRIADWDGPRTGFAITDAVAYLDTLTLFCWRPLPDGELSALRKQYGRRLIVDAYKVPGRNLDGRKRQHCKRWHITIHQPKNSTLTSLAAIQRGRFVVHAVHIAVDFLCPTSREAGLATAFLTRGVVQNWRRRVHQTHVEVNTQYWKWNRKAPRNIALYGHRQSKTGTGHCSHFEMRFTGAAACKRVDLNDLRKLVGGVDAMALLKHQTKIAFLDPTRLDRALEKLARRNLPKSQRRQPATTVNDIKKRLQLWLPRCIADEGCSLDWTSIAKARSQSLADHRPELRSCLADRVEWANFTPKPRWHAWW
jgi:hypothetical protein